ncbi:MAG: efflux RND transporter periplasmic adaptor subunit [Clostridia bacterium]|nr:efflux RND transporter periplasmic adaptor subunit [Clostridia bacterium]
MKVSKKIVIIGIIIVFTLIIIISNIINSKKQEKKLGYEVGTIEKQTLMNYISCSGNVKTENSKNLTSVLVGSKINDIKVKVGDKVEIGDVLISFDTDSLRKTANDLAITINATKEQSNININSANRAVQDAENARNTNLDQAKTARDQAQAAYDKATQAKNTTLPGLNANIANLQSEIAIYIPIEQKYNSATDTVAKAQLAYNTAESNKNNLQNQYNTLASSLDPSLVGSNPEIIELNGKLLSANTELVAAASVLEASKNELTNAKNAYDNISERYETIKTQLSNLSLQVSSLSQAVEQAKASYDQAVIAYNNASTSLDNAILSAKDAVTSAKIGADTSTLSLEEQLKSINKQLEDGNLKSTVSGTVTSINVKKGDNYQGGSILTIDGVESFIVEANIDEYDIPDIKEGMEAVIKTDATRDEELIGKVIFVAPASNEFTSSNSTSGAYASAMTSGATSNNATYLVKIEIETVSDRLRLGMNAKVNIITEKSENSLVVPYDAIFEKEDGKKFIKVINDDESFTEIEVNVGIESGYYSEIKSDKIFEGMKIVLPEVEDSTTLDDLLVTMGATGGIE